MLFLDNVIIMLGVYGNYSITKLCSITKFKDKIKLVSVFSLCFTCIPFSNSDLKYRIRYWLQIFLLHLQHIIKHKVPLTWRRKQIRQINTRISDR